MRTILVIFCWLVLTRPAYEQGLYSISTVRNFYLDFYDNDWDALLQAYQLAGSEERVFAKLTVDNLVYDSVGVRYKGQSSYDVNWTKNPLNISIDHVIKQDLLGYTAIKLSNMYHDPSCIREVLSYDILRDYMPAPDANYVNVYAGNQLLGVYTNVESVDKDFVNKYFGSDRHSFFKCDPSAPAPTEPLQGCVTVVQPESALVELGTDSACYYASYEIKSDAGWNQLVSLLSRLNQNAAEVAEILDVDRALWMHAFNNLFVNFNSYLGTGQNYYLYQDDFGVFSPVLWDMNENFGVYRDLPFASWPIGELEQLDIFWNADNDARPLISRLLAIEENRKKYLAHYRTLYHDLLKSGRLSENANTLQGILKPYIYQDKNKLYSYSAFLNGLQKTSAEGGFEITGLLSFMQARTAFLDTQPALHTTPPAISTVAQWPPAPVAGDSVWIISRITDAERVILNYKTSRYAPFRSVDMYDDGLHQDGAAGDLVYGGLIPPADNNDMVYFYIYSSNPETGAFLPRKAAFESFFYSVNHTTYPAGDVVINEIMASNSSSALDPAGEDDDWIEFFNNTDHDIDLSGYFLTDNASKPSKWTFPTQTIIKAHDYLIVWADNDTLQEGLHATFGLSKSGETLMLLDPAFNLIDSLTYKEQFTDTSLGRFPNGTGNFAYMPSTWQASNTYFFLSVNETVSFGRDRTIRIYPNPAGNDLVVDVHSTEAVHLEIFSQSGQLVISQPLPRGATTAHIDLSGLSAGFYVVRCGHAYSKLVVK